MASVVRPIVVAAVAFSSLQAQRTPSTLTAADITSRTDSVMRAAEQRGYSGAVLVAKNGTPIIRRGYGLADRAAKIPFSPQTVVQIGSNTKDFTAVAILQLSERGALSLRDSLGKFFPDVPADKRAITLQMLMNHMAGFPLGLGGDFEAVGRDALIEHAMHAPLQSQPGERERYSNMGFSLLAAIVERLTGQTYDEYVRDHILTPLGLKRTGFLLPRFAPRDVAHGYAADDDRGTLLSKPHAPDGPYWNLRGNGGMLSTVGDMLAFYHGLYDGETLLRPATREMRFPRAEPTILAGSDLVNYFMYEREPREGLEIILASTNADVPAPQVQRQLAAALGVGPGPRRVATTTPTTAAVFPDTPAGRTISEYFRAFNSADTAVVHRVLSERFVPNPDDPRTIEQRLAAYSSMRSRLGPLTLLSVDFSNIESIEVRARSDNEGEVAFTFAVESAAPYRIRSIRVMVGH
jgi:CubicO group peptidase (beta-lactamase class C family)